jgi:hypothetical protein
MARGRTLAAPLATGAAVALATAAVHATGGELGFSVCPFHAVTGWWCPFCGGSRAVAAMTRGDVEAALSYNLPAMLLLGAVTLYWMTQVYAGLRGGAPHLPRLSRRSGVVLGVVFLVFTVWRNLPQVPLGSWLAP